MQKVTAYAETLPAEEFSPAIEYLHHKITTRTKAYNTDTRDKVVPITTHDINGMYERRPSDRRATELEKEIAIKGLIFTAALHGPKAMQLKLPTLQQRKNMPLSMQHHYAVIEAADCLSRDYFVQQFITEDSDLLLRNYYAQRLFVEQRLSAKDKDKYYGVLNEFALLTKNKFDSWFEDIKQELTGLNDLYGDYWWEQKRCDKVIQNLMCSNVSKKTPHLPLTDEEVSCVLIDKNIRAQFFDALSEVPIKDRYEIGRLGLPFMTTNMKRIHMSAILKAFYHTTDDLVEFARSAKKLIHPDMTSGDIATILCALSRSIGNCEEIVELTGQLVDFTRNDYWPSGPGMSLGIYHFRTSLDELNDTKGTKIFAKDKAAEIVMTIQSLGSMRGNYADFLESAKKLLPSYAEGYFAALTASSLSQVNDDELNEIIELMDQLIHTSTDINIWSIPYFMIDDSVYHLIHIKKERKKFIKLAKDLLSSHRNDWGIVRAARALSKVREEDHSEFINMTRQLFEINGENIDQNHYELSNALYALSQFENNNDRRRFIDLVKPLIHSNINANAIGNVMSCMSHFKGGLEKFIKLIMSLIPSNPADHEAAMIASSLSQIKKNQEMYVRLAKTLLPANSSGLSIAQTAHSLSEVHEEDREKVMELAKPLIQSDTSGNNISTIISLIVQIEGDREMYVRLAKTLLPANSSGLSIAHTASSLSQVHENDRPKFIELSKQLIRSNASDNEISMIVSVLLHVRDNLVRDNREEFVRLVNQLIRPGMQSSHVVTIVSTLGKVRTDLEKFIALVNKLIRPDMQNDHIVTIVSALGKVRTDLEKFIALVNKLIRPDMEGRYIASIFASLAQIYGNPEDFVTAVKQLLRPNMGQYDVAEIVSLLSRGHSNRESLIARILLFMRHVDYNLNVFRQISETRLDQEVRLGGMRAVAGGENPYAVGINVHAAGRDMQTIAAVEQLIQNWNPTQKEIDDVFADFWKALLALPTIKEDLAPAVRVEFDKLKLDAQQTYLTRKERLLRALGVDENLEPIQRSTEDFGGLLTGEGGLITLMRNDKCLQLNARELIARFWHFANTYVEDTTISSTAAITPVDDIEMEKERENIRTAIINGLTEGLQKDSERSSHVVCDPGKIQRLVVTTLQGRLKGADGKFVDVDGLDLVNVVPEVVVENIAGPPETPTIRNLDEIAQYLKPFIDSLSHPLPQMRPQNGSQFFMRLFEYRSKLENGEIPAFNKQHINLDPSQVVYYVRMMEPGIKQGDKVITRAEINPERSLVVQLGFDDFKVNDYMDQFGERDRAQLAEARVQDDRRA